MSEFNCRQCEEEMSDPDDTCATCGAKGSGAPICSAPSIVPSAIEIRDTIRRVGWDIEGLTHYCVLIRNQTMESTLAKSNLISSQNEGDNQPKD